tara:strand:+ start:954118 stop:955149 length:1032 start_codon:yes stop_codon:yes gene_type:complete
MSVQRQICPSCGRQLEFERQLELSGDVVDRGVQCPACQTIFPLEATDHNPFVDPLPAGSATSRANPYQPSRYVEVQPSPVAHAGPIAIMSRSIDEVISVTSTVFVARWGMLILMAVILIAVLMFAIMLPLFMVVVLSESVSESAEAIGMVVLAPVILLVSGYLCAGSCRVCLALARNEPSPLSNLLPPTRVVGRLIAGAAVMLFAAGLIVAVYSAVAFAASSVMDPDVAGPVFAIIGFAAFFVGTLMIQWLLWPWIFVVSDDKGTALGSITTGYQIARHNLLTSFLLIIISTVLSVLGSACYIGQVVTAPLTMLMFAIAYLMMTDQPIAYSNEAVSPPPPLAL